MSAAMLAAVYGMRTLLLEHAALPLVLLAEILTGLAIYWLLSIALKPEGWREIRIILEQIAANRK